MPKLAVESSEARRAEKLRAHLVITLAPPIDVRRMRMLTPPLATRTLNPSQLRLILALGEQLTSPPLDPVQLLRFAVSHKTRIARSLPLQSRGLTQFGEPPNPQRPRTLSRGESESETSVVCRGAGGL